MYILLLLFHCNHCGTNFATNMGAMVMHSKAHLDRDYIKIYEITKGGLEKAKRPEHHAYNQNTGQYYGVSDTKLHSIMIPDDTPRAGGKVGCRHCDQYWIEFPNSANAQTLAKRVGKITKHEMRCNENDGNAALATTRQEPGKIIFPRKQSCQTSKVSSR